MNKKMNACRLIIVFFIGLICFTSCKKNGQIGDKVSENSPKQHKRKLAKFEPSDGKVILFVGQELEAIGGVGEFNDGYLDHFKRPAGWTAYTFLSPGDTLFGYQLKGLDGIWSTDNWGDKFSNMSMQIAGPNYENMALAIGLYMVNHETSVANGEHDGLIIRLGEYLKSIAPRPVFLRIGYEFDGYPWNHYDRNNWLVAYKRVVDKLDSMGCENVAYVWQSTGFVSNMEHLEAWYPGDEYVDWCGFSFFMRWEEQNMIEFARAKGKPVFIAEASPTISDFTVKFDGKTKETVLSNQGQAEEAWEKWFVPLFRTMEENPDVVKAVSYINCYWKSHPFWFDNPTFQKIDARLQTNEWISNKWKEKIYAGRYIHSSPSLYEDLKEHK